MARSSLLPKKIKQTKAMSETISANHQLIPSNTLPHLPHLLAAAVSNFTKKLRGSKWLPITDHGEKYGWTHQTIGLPSLKLTGSHLEIGRAQKRKRSSSNHLFFRCENVSFREGTYPAIHIEIEKSPLGVTKSIGQRKNGSWQMWWENVSKNEVSPNTVFNYAIASNSWWSAHLKYTYLVLFVESESGCANK